jgi:hypothetical protein
MSHEEDQTEYSWRVAAGVIIVIVVSILIATTIRYHMSHQG